MPNGKKVSIIFVPYGDARPRSLRLSKSLLWTVLILWFGLVVAAGLILSQHIDYKIAQRKVKQFQNRMAYYDQQMNDTLELVEELKKNDGKLRQLLALKTEKEIIRHGNIRKQPEGTGGPTFREK